jgi:hypothetical protein
LRAFPDAVRRERADHSPVVYAVAWSENGGIASVGKLEVGSDSLHFGGRPGRELSYVDVSGVRIDRRPELRLAGRPTLVIESRTGDSFRVASLDSAGTLHELAERLESARRPA